MLRVSDAGHDSRVAVGEAEEEPRAGGHIQRVIRPVVAQLVDAIVGEVQRVIGVPVKAHCVAYACRLRQISDTALSRALGSSTALKNQSSSPLHLSADPLARPREGMCYCLIENTI